VERRDENSAKAKSDSTIDASEGFYYDT